MRRRIRKLRFQIWRAGGVDLVVSHAPAQGLGDGEDPAHIGFSALRELLDRYQPAYLVHGHVHLNYDKALEREISYGKTKVVNAYERYVLDIPDALFHSKRKTRKTKRSI